MTSTVLKPALLLILGLALWSCSAPKKVVSDSKSAVPDAPYPKNLPPRLMPSDSAFVEVEAQYIKGISAFEMGSYDEALDILLAVYVRVPHFAGVNYALADCYLKINDFDNAAFYGFEAIKIEPDNKFYRLKLAEIYGSRGNIDGAIEQLLKASQSHPKDLEILFTLVNAYAAQNKLAESNAVLQKILNISGNDLQLRAKRFSNFNELGQKDSALAELKRMQKMQPDDSNTLQLLARFQVENNDKQGAKITLRQVLKVEPGNVRAMISLADLFIQDAKWDSSGAVLRPVVTDSLIPAQNKLEIIQFLYDRFSENDKNEALKTATQDLIETFRREEPDFAMGHALAADFYMRAGETAKALEALEITTRLMPQNDNAWKNRVQFLYQAEQFEEAIKVAKEADAIFPDDAFIQFILGSSYFLKGNPADALVWLRSAVRVPARDDLKSVIWGMIGDVHAAARSWAAADSAYDRSLALNADNENVLNNYAYYLSERDVDLEKAEKMALQAIKIAPDNAAYLDTVGWVYFKLKNYKKALEFIQKAVNTGEASATVLEHLGDCFDKLGKPNDARIWWKKALEKDPGRNHLKQKI